MDIESIQGFVKTYLLSITMAASPVKLVEAFILAMMIVRAGDIAVNPGPSFQTLGNDNFTEYESLRGFVLAHQNINSLWGKIDELRLVVGRLPKLGLLEINESKLDWNIDDSELNIASFCLYCKDRNKYGGSIVVYIKDDVPVVRRSDLENNETAILWLEIVLPKVKGFLVGMCYRPLDSSNYAENIKCYDWFTFEPW